MPKERLTNDDVITLINPTLENPVHYFFGEGKIFKSSLHDYDYLEVLFEKGYRVFIYPGGFSAVKELKGMGYVEVVF